MAKLYKAAVELQVLKDAAMDTSDFDAAARFEEMLLHREPGGGRWASARAQGERQERGGVPRGGPLARRVHRRGLHRARVPGGGLHVGELPGRGLRRGLSQGALGKLKALGFKPCRTCKGRGYFEMFNGSRQGCESCGGSDKGLQAARGCGFEGWA